MVRRSVILASAWVGFDFAFVRDLSPFYSYYGSLGVGRVDDAIGIVMLTGAILAAIGTLKHGEEFERVGYVLAGVAWIVHSLGFVARVVATALGVEPVTAPIPLGWSSLLGTPLVYAAVGLLLIELSRYPYLRGAPR
ncbi:MAG: hypothetical protein JWM98_1819 [Thermoleophilia bacterium]|nr:hypothetical protein [Thermoleophilia bacterium]